MRAPANGKPALALAVCAVAIGIAGCGSAEPATRKAVTIARPPDLGPPQPDAKDTGEGLPPEQQTGNVTRFGFVAPHGESERAKFYTASGCGTERWAVKTMTDPAANEVKLTPQESTILDLTSIAPPVAPTDRVGPTETTTFQVGGTVTFAKREADSDYHLVIEDPQGDTMIVESVAPSCAAGSVVLSEMEAVRKAIDERLPELASGRTVRPMVAVAVDGVGFFDRIHGQTGVAPNGIELHPLTAITFAATGAHTATPPVHLTEKPGTD